MSDAGTRAGGQNEPSRAFCILGLLVCVLFTAICKELKSEMRPDSPASGRCSCSAAQSEQHTPTFYYYLCCSDHARADERGILRDLDRFAAVGRPITQHPPNLQQNLSSGGIVVAFQTASCQHDVNGRMANTGSVQRAASKHPHQDLLRLRGREQHDVETARGTSQGLYSRQKTKVVVSCIACVTSQLHLGDGV